MVVAIGSWLSHIIIDIHCSITVVIIFGNRDICSIINYRIAGAAGDWMVQALSYSCRAPADDEVCSALCQSVGHPMTCDEPIHVHEPTVEEDRCSVDCRTDERLVGSLVQVVVEWVHWLLSCFIFGEQWRNWR